MSDKIKIEIGEILDEIFKTAEKFREAFESEFEKHSWHFKGWDGTVDYYPAYNYPPSNIMVDKENNLIFEFALAGFDPESLNLQFTGDYLLLTAKVSESRKKDDNTRFLKRRLKFKDVENHKYYVPASKYNRQDVKAGWNNGILTVFVPVREKQAEETVEIKIEKE